MLTKCQKCQQNFEIRSEDSDFHNRVGSPSPTLCPLCRFQRRSAFRNERKLYRRKCDLTRKSIVSFIHPEKPYKVYDLKEWWGDGWNALEYGRNFDFNRPFFDQFKELHDVVPRISMTVSHCENCDYAPYSVYSRNCYMCISCCYSEDLEYCYQTNKSQDCFDCSLCKGAELCYECLYCTNVFNCSFCQCCENSHEIYFCQDCRSCENCIGCKNLIGKKYHIFNKQTTKEEFEALKLDLQDYQKRTNFAKKSKEFFVTQPQRAYYFINCENCTGDHLTNSKNSYYCFDANELEDCAYTFIAPGTTKDSQDIQYCQGAELVYDSLSAVNNYNSRFVLHSWDCKHVDYVDECFYSQYLFGCIGLKKKEYCILNKQYSREKYEKLLPRIIEHLKKTNEWGQFFPVHISPYGYNETLANSYFPLSKEQAISQGFNWSDYEQPTAEVEKIVSAAQVSATIDLVPDEILNWAIKCEVTEKPFRISAQELKFYRRQKLPLPRKHPDERYRERMAMQSQRKLYDHNCQKCGGAMKTSYSLTSPEILFCEKCYLETLL